MQLSLSVFIDHRPPQSVCVVSRRVIYIGLAVLLLIAMQSRGSCLAFQVAQTNPRAAASRKRRVRRSSLPRAHRHPSTETRLHAAGKTGPAEHPAQVSLSNGLLTVTANNSGLGQILTRIAGMSGMTVEGYSTGGRVYGVYGPGQPNEVLTSLLTGSGYNFLMLGRSADGTPRKLLLMRKVADSQLPPANPVAQPTQNQAASSADEQEPPGPGAIVHVPPSDVENDNDQDTDVRVQRNLKRLEQMHQSQTKQNHH